ncbi:hypothetical protein CgunFtcFv8_020385 [Champsocephalus gunnari]|uniref:Uncharacterized protein n=1 Tax=Champsocephalus gunnari TaxID=52237 RepID=A0AAN8EAZ3_CHAGU|nr:hypothetical protein CgunFtcFv8_020385 [Champsocephalus gunnari]
MDAPVKLQAINQLQLILMRLNCVPWRRESAVSCCLSVGSGQFITDAQPLTSAPVLSLGKAIGWTNRLAVFG